MDIERCCENCGNEFCANSVVAVWWDQCVDDSFTTHWKPREYSPEQFARLCVSLGYLPNIKYAQQFCKRVMKTEYTAIDMEECARWFERESRVKRGDNFQKAIWDRSQQTGYDTNAKNRRGG